MTPRRSDPDDFTRELQTEAQSIVAMLEGGSNETKVLCVIVTQSFVGSLDPATGTRMTEVHVGAKMTDSTIHEGCAMMSALTDTTAEILRIGAGSGR